jgi:hypothetical protein
MMTLIYCLLQISLSSGWLPGWLCCYLSWPTGYCCGKLTQPAAALSDTMHPPPNHGDCSDIRKPANAQRSGTNVSKLVRLTH